ncbi:intradiol ring-cleavage dioxygenase [Streptomyces sp. NBC_00582]|uniref:intradiol ring-cleavage dioxygenase n=1 Tax=Streptomyces sp. NBC_00582 TaxID=2975783 RepID=UPI002E803F8A|nr:intradiol ring-cleavage dioxygenase [Streptomyces sp. NBC_00582]WUB67480.1 intradiol ring-cleavage dioxygenase [Streptomyces sp. NBC_00582]
MSDHTPSFMNRRKVLAAGGAGAAAVGLGLAYAATAKADQAQTSASAADTSASDDALTLTKETIEGPYYLDYDLHRVDITEGKQGTPLDLRIQVRNSQDAKPVSNVAVDIWHCDALGIYSGYEEASAAGSGGSLPSGTPTAQPTAGGSPGMHEEPDSKTTYMRGFQMTDKDGWVRFRSIVPGWYTGRAVHIHVKVHTKGVLLNDAYADGTTVHTGQLFFPEDLIDAITKVKPYTSNENPLTTNSSDGIYSGDTTTDGMLAVSWDKKNAARTVKASIRMAVDLDTENDGRSGGMTMPSGSPSS